MRVHPHGQGGYFRLAQSKKQTQTIKINDTMALFLNRGALIASYFRKILSDITILTAPPTPWPCTQTGSQQGTEQREITFQWLQQILFQGAERGS